MALCGKCGSSVAEGVAFCPHCGAAVGAAVPPPPAGWNQLAPNRLKHGPRSSAATPTRLVSYSPPPPPRQAGLRRCASGPGERPAGKPGGMPVLCAGLAYGDHLSADRPAAVCALPCGAVDRGLRGAHHYPVSADIWFFGGRYSGFFSFVGLLSLLVSLVTLVAWLTLMILAYQGKRYEVPVAAGIAKSIAGNPTV